MRQIEDGTHTEEGRIAAWDYPGEDRLHNLKQSSNPQETNSGSSLWVGHIANRGIWRDQG